MARAEVASASVSSDSITGLAQSIAKPAYRRLLTAEPALRRAVPALIVAFLITIAIGAFVQVIDHRRTALSVAANDIDTIAEVLSDRLGRPRTDEPKDARNNWRRTQDELNQALTPRTTAGGRQILVSNAEGMVIASAPSTAGLVGRRLLEIIGDTHPLAILGASAGVQEVALADGTFAIATVRNLKSPGGRLRLIQ